MKIMNKFKRFYQENSPKMKMIIEYFNKNNFNMNKIIN